MHQRVDAVSSTERMRVLQGRLSDWRELHQKYTPSHLLKSFMHHRVPGDTGLFTIHLTEHSRPLTNHIIQVRNVTDLSEPLMTSSFTHSHPVQKYYKRNNSQYVEYPFE